ncbi:MAG: ABC transporter permease [Lachnospiraceae bacterium]|nr:ABC transporter permease [Lachnospiraceae bacterium]
MKKTNTIKKAAHFLGENAFIIGLIFMMLVGTLINPNFLTLSNISNILRQMSTISVVTLGMAVVIISGSIDLSVGSLFCLTAFIASYLSQYGTFLAVAGTLLAGILIGGVNGFLVTKMKVHPWIATLSMMLGLRGLVLILTGENTYKPGRENLAFERIARGGIGSFLNYPLIIMVVLAVIFALMMKYTRIGRDFYVCGGNREAARMMGINVERAINVSFILCGFTCAVSGIILAARLGSVSPLAGDGNEMYAIASCVVGGVYLTGGRGKIHGAFIGSMIIGLLTNIFNMQSLLSTFWESVITGSLVLIVVLLQQVSAVRAEHNRKINENV